MRNYDFGNKLYNYRTKLGFTQQQLALELGVTDKSISKWENGKAYPTTETLQKLSTLFETTIDELLKENKKEKDIKKIVITGGPCAGKSTAMSYIQNKFTKDGYNVIFVNETATEIINSGITPNTAESILEFEKAIFLLQLQKEAIYEKAAKQLKSDKVLIVYDRGVNDLKAYLTDTEFKMLLSSFKQNEISLRDRYDAVFHLVTAANGALDFYTLENNIARYETKEEAIIVDNKLIKAYNGHPHFNIIDNSTNFENKMKRLLSSISHFLKAPEPYEIERKFLIKFPDLKKLEKLGTKVNIIQTYLKSNNTDEVRIRQRGLNGNYIYTLTTKKNISPTTRIELEKRLSEKEYLELLLSADPDYKPIIKDRYCLTYKNQNFEIDIYDFFKDKAILEIELIDEDHKITFPKYIEVILEVTENYDYRNKNLAKVLKK